MQPNSLIHIAMDSMRFTFSNIKKLSSLAIVPATVGTVLSILNVYITEPIAEVFAIILSLAVFIPFTIKWTQLSLGKKVDSTYKNSFFWNVKTTKYFFKYIKILLILTLLLFPITLLLFPINLISQSLSSNGFISITLLALLAIWSLTLVLRMAMILPAFVDGKDIKIQTALQSTKNTNTAILLSGIIFSIITLLFLLAFLTIYMLIIETHILENNFVILTISMGLQNAFGIFLSATQITYLTFVYKKIMVK